MSASNLAYVIYTSGSTGRPKGVAIEHRNAARLLYWAREAFGEDERACVLASTSVCFDLSVFELFVPLCWGGRAVLVANALAPWPEDAGITLVNTVPSAMAELVRTRGVPASVKVVALAGEPLHEGLARSVHALGVERVYNLYGPSEDTTYSTWYRVERGAEAAVCIGRPVTGTRCYILDGHGAPVPVGVTGELHVAGAGLARGYLRRPELDAERFVADPFADAPGARMYRTGDLARYRASGEIEFLGRLDHQVKIRGYRIELGEIEAALLRHPAVREAAVAVFEEGTGGKRLAAYVAGAELPDPAELRAALRRSLPDHMIPAIFVPLAALPMTANGKIDRRSLPAPAAAAAAPAGAGARNPSGAPSTDTERAVAAIWAELLGTEKIGADDNFFDIGGHSLLVMQMVARLRQRFGPDLDIGAVDLFVETTVRSLARRIDGGRVAASDGGDAIRERAVKQRAALARRRPRREKGESVVD